MPDLTTSTAVDTFMGSANAAAMRTSLELGTAATTDSTDYATAAQGTDARTPTAHASTHLTGESDAIQSATASQPGLATAAQITKLDGIEAGADVTNFVNVASTISDTEAITTLADADKVPIVASGILKNIAYSALKTLLNAIYGLKSATLDQFADVTQTAGKTLSITESTTLAGGSHSGTNTGDNAVNSNYSGLVSNATHIGDATGATELTLATVNPNVGSFGSATAAPAVTVNAKGLVTAVSTNTITPAVGSITGLGTGVATALAVNVGSAGATVVTGGALGTPSSGTLTNCTGLPVAGITASTSDALGVGSLEIGNASDTTLARSSAGNLSIEGNLIYRAGGSFVGTPFEYSAAASDEATALTAGTSKLTFRMPCAMTITSVRASVGTAPTGSTLIVDINQNGTSILSTELSIDATEKTSTTAATPAVISDTALADDAEVTIDIDQIGSTVAGAGLKVTLLGTRA